MDAAELQERMARWEDLHTEFKAWPVHPDDLAAAIVALANTDGGQLVLGVAEDRSRNAHGRRARAVSALVALQAPGAPGGGRATEAQGDERPAPRRGRRAGSVGGVQHGAEGQRRDGAGAEAEERA